MNKLLINIQKCEVCKKHLPLEPRPEVQFGTFSKIIIIGQAPGRKVHETGMPWNDASGKRLREWMRVDEATFYNRGIFSMLPMAFCYPGRGFQATLPKA